MPLEHIRVHRRLCCLCTLVFISLLACRPTVDDSQKLGSRRSELRNGDLLFRRGGSTASLFVAAVDMDGFYTHVGLLVEQDGELMALHSVPDEAAEGEIDMVKIEPIDDFYRGSRALNGAIYRTSLSRDSLRIVTGEALRLLAKGVPFDSEYNLADSSSLYCTELLEVVFGSVGYGLSAGNYTFYDMGLFYGDHLLPSDLLKNGDLTLIHSF